VNTTEQPPHAAGATHGQLRIRPVHCFYAGVELEELGVNLLAFSAVPSAAPDVQFTIVPEDPEKLVAEAARAKLPVEGPHSALLVQGDDHLRALANLHRRAALANINIYATGGVTDGRGSFGYMLYVGEDRFASAVEAFTLDLDVD
jgi:hypothetical protein